MNYTISFDAEMSRLYVECWRMFIIKPAKAQALVGEMLCR